MNPVNNNQQLNPPQPQQPPPQPQQAQNPNAQTIYEGYPQYYQARQYNLHQMRMIESNNVIKRLMQKRVISGMKVEPKDIYFATQDSDEKIYVYMRRHWTENIGWVTRNFLYCFIPPLLSVLFSVLDIDLSFLRQADYIIFLLLYYSLILTNVFKDFFDWYFDPYIITNERVVHYEFKPFSRYEVKETSLESIENVREESAGLLAGLWGYGTLIISTEAQDDLFVFKRIHNPTLVRDILVDLTEVAKKYNGEFR